MPEEALAIIEHALTIVSDTRLDDARTFYADAIPQPDDVIDLDRIRLGLAHADQRLEGGDLILQTHDLFLHSRAIQDHRALCGVENAEQILCGQFLIHGNRYSTDGHQRKVGCDPIIGALNVIFVMVSQV